MTVEKLLTWPESTNASTSIRARALVFHDPASLSLLTQVERIALSEATVLVVGETGTGKELIARHIHTVSGRKGPFVPVNCGAFSESLIDAELFGHESGAFTGASHARAGWFEAANGGTLFLDEIGDLSLPLQVKLLRVLQERQVVRLGSRRGIALDVRLVAATNIDLARAVAAQHFRADLYYRLSVASVRLPPLRERPADILPLARHFIAVYQARTQRASVSLSEAAQQALLAYGWPGNIRELENAIHFALIVCRDDVIQEEDIKLVPLISHAVDGRNRRASDAEAPLVLGGLGLPQPKQPVHSASHAPSSTASPSFGNLPSPTGLGPAADASPLDQLAEVFKALLNLNEADLFDKVESALVHTAYAYASRNQVRAARALGITRNMLRTQLKRHGLLGAAEDDSEALDPSTDDVLAH